MLQNRVDPFGTLIKTKARGTFMGNRGLMIRLTSLKKGNYTRGPHPDTAKERN